jgi:Protein of unknown function (DUF3105)
MVDGGDDAQDREGAGTPAHEPTPDRAPGAEPAAAHEAAAPAPEPARRLRGYVVGGVLVLLAVVAVIALLTSGDGGDDEAPVRASAAKPGDVLPANGLFAIPDEDVETLSAAADVAGCEVESYKVASRDHVDPDVAVRYPSNPPTSGRHSPVPAQDGAYEQSPNVKELVHTLEHSRVIIWFKRDLPRKARASLKAYFDHDSALLVLVPDTTGMEYDVAATAWHRNPQPRGTGRLLGCPEYNDDVYTALERFKERNRGRGPEIIP